MRPVPSFSPVRRARTTLPAPKPKPIRAPIAAPAQNLGILTVRISLPPEEIRPNGRADRWTFARVYAAYKREAMFSAMQPIKVYMRTLGQVKWEPVACPQIRVTAFFAGHQAMDEDNLLASVKAAIDGLKDAKVITDDKGAHYLPPMCHARSGYPHVEIAVWQEWARE